MSMFNEVYYSLIGELISPLPGVPNLFGEGTPCEKWYREMLEAYERICERLGVCDEDDDVEAIINSFLMIQYTLCAEMFRLGGEYSHADFIL